MCASISPARSIQWSSPSVMRGQNGAVPDARYDGLADWYDDWAAPFMRPFARLVAAYVATFVRPDSTVLDVCCGTGLFFEALRDAGVRLIGLDVSADQLRVASTRSVPVVRADAAALPVRDESVDVALGAFLHRDVDDFEAAVCEIARSLRRGGRVAYVGTHPCFVAPFLDRSAERAVGTIRIGDGYGDANRRFDGAALSRLTITAGSRNLSLAAFLHAFVSAGLQIVTFEELDTEARPWTRTPDDQTIVPWNVLLVASKAES
jgi:SAM-dependent methyltransferase